MKKLKAFTWGYEGWGNASAHFVRVVDSIERARGFKPPVFVDLRMSRQVRARDFQDRNFEAIVGKSRYIWMKRLGNARIASKKGKRIQIKDPSAAKDLLDLIVDLQQKNRRVVMFCSCLEALLRTSIGGPSCHRVTVASLLLKEARRRGIGLELAEWPGEKPSFLSLNATEAQREALERDATYIPIGPADQGLSPLLKLGWASCVTLKHRGGDDVIVTGPAYVKAGVWKLEVLELVPSGSSAIKRARSAAERFLRSGYGPRRT
jgi:hypothetical protein